MCCFSTSIFWVFSLDFRGSWASKMEPSPPRCAAASGVLKPTALYACIKYCSNYLRGGQDLPNSRSDLAMLRSMLAHFSLWGAFFSLLAGSQTLLALFWLMLVVFFGLGVAAGSILGGLGRVLEPSNKHFSMIFGVNTHASQKYSSCNKTTVFAMF